MNANKANLPVLRPGDKPFPAASPAKTPSSSSDEYSGDEDEARLKRDLAHAARDITFHAAKSHLKGDNIVYGEPGKEGLIDKVVGNTVAGLVTATAETLTDGAVTPVAPAIYAATEKATSALSSAFTPKAEISTTPTGDASEEITSQPGQSGGAEEADDGMLSNKKKSRKPSSTTLLKRTKFGKDSIHPVGVLDHLAIETPDYDGPSNLFTELPAFCAANPEMFSIQAHQARVTSNLYRCDRDGSVLAGVPQTEVVLPTVGAPLVANATVHVKVRWAAAFPISILDPALLEVYKIGSSINGKAVQTALEPKLQAASNNLFNKLAASLFADNARYDNSALYAKGALYAMQIDLSDELQLAITPIAFPAAAGVSYIDLTDANLTPSSFETPLARGDIMLLQNKDYCDADLQVIYWLASAERRVGAAAGIQNAQANYTSWPQIRFTLVKYGAADNAPNVAAITSAQMYAFLQKIATTRHEWDDFCRGLTLALDLIGTKYHEAAGQRYGRTSDINISTIRLRHPFDYNFLLRTLDLQFGYDQHRRRQVEAWIACSKTLKVCAMSAWSLLRSVAATTLLQSTNMTRGTMITYCTNVEGNNQATNILRSVYCVPEQERDDGGMYLMIRALLAETTGFVCEPNLYPDNAWNGFQGGTENAANALGGFAAMVPPQDGCLLAADQMFKLRPQEWGIVGPDPIVNFTADLKKYGAAATRGLYACNGEPAYDQRASGPEPYMYVPYGAQMANIAERLSGGNNRQLWMQRKSWNFGQHNAWQAAVLDGRPEYINALNIFKPCTIMTFDWDTVDVEAAVVRAQDLQNASILFTLENVVNKPLACVGYALTRTHMYPNQQFQLPHMSLPLSRRARAAANSASGHTPAADAQPGPFQ